MSGLDLSELSQEHATMCCREFTIRTFLVHAHATLSWEDRQPAEHVVTLLAERGIQVVSLEAYYHADTQARRNGIVFGYGGPTDMQLRLALQEIATVVGNSPTGA